MSYETEARVVASVLVQPEIFHDCELRPSEFSNQLLRQIWQTIGSMLAKGETVDATTVASYGYSIADLGELVSQSGFAPSNAPHYADLMRAESSRRAAESILRDGVGRIAEPGSDVNSISADIQMSLERIAVGEPLIRPADAIDALRTYIGESRELTKRFGVAGIPTGHQPLRMSIGGWRRKSFYVLAARPGEGKSSAAWHSAVTAAEMGVPVGYVTLEMTSDELLARHMAAKGGQHLGEVLAGRLSNSAMGAGKDFADLPIVMDETSSQLEAVLSRIAAMRREGAEVVFVDHFGLIHAEAENRVRELGIISWSLRQAAKRLGVAIVGLYQLNRASESENRRPSLHDLRGSGEIEENATHVMLLHNGTKTVDGVPPPAVREMEWHIVKNRNGPRGMMDITSDFDPRYQTWI